MSRGVTYLQVRTFQSDAISLDGHESITKMLLRIVNFVQFHLFKLNRHFGSSEIETKLSFIKCLK